MTLLPQTNSALMQRFFMQTLSGRWDLERAIVARPMPPMHDLPSERSLTEFTAADLIAYAQASLKEGVGAQVRAVLDMMTVDVPDITLTEGTLPPQYELFGEQIVLCTQDLRTRTAEDLDAHLAHHYAMHLTGRAYSSSTFLLHCAYRAYREGIARGVEHLVATSAQSAQRDMYFLLAAQALTNIAPTTPEGVARKELYPALTERFGLPHRILAPYAVGHALFAIRESEVGPGIYAEALRDPRVVLE